MPRAVEIFPSIPAKPRLAKVSTPIRGDAKPSMSRIGRDDEIKSEVPDGRFLANSLAIVASDHPAKSATNFEARAPYFCHFCA